jgi:hypothetical protein
MVRCTRVELVYLLQLLAGPERFELPTAGFEDQNSSTELRTEIMASREGFEPPPTVLETDMLPLHYRDIINRIHFKVLYQLS